LPKHTRHTKRKNRQDANDESGFETTNVLEVGVTVVGCGVGNTLDDKCILHNNASTHTYKPCWCSSFLPRTSQTANGVESKFITIY
jgi:hypothetical protein